MTPTKEQALASSATSPEAIDVAPYLKYKEACKDLQEAKEAGKLIKRGVAREIFPEECIILRNDEVYFLNCNGEEWPWEDFEIIEKDAPPSFQIEGDGGGPYTPRYFQTGWTFGCKFISHETIRSCQELPKDVTEVKIGRGVFTREQIKELHDYA